MNTVKQIASISILLGLLAGTAQAANVTWQGGDGAWETAANWVTNDDPPQNRVPEAGDYVLILDNAGTARITADTGSVPASGNLGNIRVQGADRAVIQTGGAVNSSGIMWLGGTGGGTYELQGGTLYVGYIMSMNEFNQSNQISNFTVSGGTATFANFRTGNKGSGAAYITVTDGSLNVNNNLTLALGGGTTDTAYLTQGGGSVTINGQLQLGTGTAISGSAEVIVNLHGGEMTIKGAIPLSFVGGTVNYLGFNGGALYVKTSSGITDFTTLTAIPNSDFRSFGEPAAANTLQFTTENIGGTDYTKIIAIVPPPGGTVITIR